MSGAETVRLKVNQKFRKREDATQFKNYLLSLKPANLGGTSFSTRVRFRFKSRLS